jgi:hypothetical protein
MYGLISWNVSGQSYITFFLDNEEIYRFSLLSYVILLSIIFFLEKINTLA